MKIVVIIHKVKLQNELFQVKCFIWTGTDFFFARGVVWFCFICCMVTCRIQTRFSQCWTNCPTKIFYLKTNFLWVIIAFNAVDTWHQKKSIWIQKKPDHVPLQMSSFLIPILLFPYNLEKCKTYRSLFYTLGLHAVYIGSLDLVFWQFSTFMKSPMAFVNWLLSL